MKRVPWVLCAAGVILLGVGTYLVARSRGPMRDEVIAGSQQGGCFTPLRVLEPADSNGSRRAAIILHGLAANARIMQTLGQSLAADGWRVYLMDLPGHGRSFEPYTFARAEECARLVLQSLSQTHQIVPQETILVGHSMGGAIAVRMADHFPTAATIAISAAPLVRPRRMPSNLLILSAQYDFPPLQATARLLLQAGGSERDKPDDFAERRAIKLALISLASHTSLLFDPRVWQGTAEWADRAVAVSVARSPSTSPLRALAGAWMGLLGLILLFPVSATMACVALRCPQAPRSALPAEEECVVKPHTWIRALISWAVASFSAVAILTFWLPASAVRLVGGDYLASFLFVAGLILVTLFWKEVRQLWRLSLRPILMASLLALITILAFGAWLDWQLTDAWLIMARWWRLFLLAPLCLPYFFAEEAAMGPPRAARHPARFMLFLLLRLVLLLAQIFAFYLISNANMLLILLSLYLGAFSVLQRLAADAVRRRTGSASSAALFDAILAAWFIAAVFPLR